MSKNRKVINNTVPSAVAVAAFARTGAGAHGKRGKGRTSADERSRSQVRSDLRRGEA